MKRSTRNPDRPASQVSSYARVGGVTGPAKGQRGARAKKCHNPISGLLAPFGPSSATVSPDAIARRDAGPSNHRAGCPTLTSVDISDGDLVRRARTGHTAAFRLLVERHWPTAAGLILQALTESRVPFYAR
jgi:hypothetical protein